MNDDVINPNKTATSFHAPGSCNVIDALIDWAAQHRSVLPSKACVVDDQGSAVIELSPQEALCYPIREVWWFDHHVNTMYTAFTVGRINQIEKGYRMWEFGTPDSN